MQEVAYADITPEAEAQTPEELAQCAAQISIAAADKMEPEFDKRGRRLLFRVYHNGGAPISFGSRRFKEDRKKDKAARKALRRQGEAR